MSYIHVFLVEDCQRRWKNLREAFVKAHKKKTSGSSGAMCSNDSWILDVLSSKDDFSQDFCRESHGFTWVKIGMGKVVGLFHW